MRSELDCYRAHRQLWMDMQDGVFPGTRDLSYDARARVTLAALRIFLEKEERGPLSDEEMVDILVPLCSAAREADDPVVFPLGFWDGKD